MLIIKSILYCFINEGLYLKPTNRTWWTQWEYLPYRLLCCMPEVWTLMKTVQGILGSIKNVKSVPQVWCTIFDTNFCSDIAMLFPCVIYFHRSMQTKVTQRHHELQTQKKSYMMWHHCRSLGEVKCKNVILSFVKAFVCFKGCKYACKLPFLMCTFTLVQSSNRYIGTHTTTTQRQYLPHQAYRTNGETGYFNSTIYCGDERYFVSKVSEINMVINALIFDSHLMENKLDTGHVSFIKVVWASENSSVKFSLINIFCSSLCLH